jgi:hypothetical protein
MNNIISFITRNFNFNTWTRVSTGEKTYTLTLFGFKFVLGTEGNLIRPCIHLDRMKTITIRFNFQNEIMVYLPMTFSNGKTRPFNWNWNWLARKYGKAQEAPHGTVFFYNGILGNHCDV